MKIIEGPRKAGLAPALLLLLAMALALSAPALADRATSERLMQQGIRQMANKKWAEADLTLQKAIAADPRWDKPRDALARLYHGFKNFEGAAVQWRMAMKISPRNPDYPLRLAQTLEDARKWPEAVQAWGAYRKLKPKDPRAPYAIARIYLETGDLGKAETAIAEAMKLDSANLKFVLVQAQIDFQQGQDDPAQLQLAQAGLEKVVQGLPEGHETRAEAQKLLDEVNSELLGRKIRLGLLVGVPVLILILAFVGRSMMRRVDIKPPPTRLDPSSAESVCRFALDHAAALTGLPRGLAWSVTMEGNRMDLRASELIADLGPFHRRALDRAAMQKWLEGQGGVPFLYKAEIKEPGFLQALPGLVDDLSGVELNVGVPLVWKGRFEGLVVLGRSRSAGKLDLRSRFEKNTARLQEIAEQAGQALEQLLKEQREVTDVETGLPNQSYYDEQAAEMVDGCRTAGLPLTLFMVRMDAMEEIEEKYGDNLAVEIMQQTVQVLEECLRQEDNTILCRLDGLVFGVIAPERGMREAPSLAQRLKAAVDGLKISRNLPKPTGCVAYGVFPDHADDAASLRRVTQRAFRDAVYLEGNRILEAERGGGDREPEAEEGKRPAAGGRRALVGEAEETPTAPAGGSRPFVPGRPLSGARPPAEEEAPADGRPGRLAGLETRKMERPSLRGRPAEEPGGAEEEPAPPAGAPTWPPRIRASEPTEGPPAAPAAGPRITAPPSRPPRISLGAAPRTPAADEAPPSRPRLVAPGAPSRPTPPPSTEEPAPPEAPPPVEAPAPRPAPLIRPPSTEAPVPRPAPPVRPPAAEAPRPAPPVRPPATEAPRPAPPVRPPATEAPAPRPAPSLRPPTPAAPPVTEAPPVPAAPPPIEVDPTLEDLGIDPETQFCYQDTFEDLADYEVGVAEQEGKSLSILYLRLLNLEELKAAGAAEYSRVRRDLTSLVHTFLREGVDVPGVFGDEFALLLTNTTVQTAANLAGQIVMTLENLEAGGVTVHPSVGVATFPDLPASGLELIDHARSAAASGTRVQIFEAV